MAVQLKSQEDSTKPRSKGNVHDINSFKKKPNPFDYDPIGRNILSAAVKVELAMALDGMWTPNHQQTGELPNNVSAVNDPSKETEQPDERVPISSGELMQDLNPGLKRWFKSKEVKLQDLHKGLYMWLEAYCPIPNNVCILLDKDKHIARTKASAEKRLKLGKPAYEDNHYVFKKYKKLDRATSRRYEIVKKEYKMTWDSRTKNKNILHPVKGWYGYRPPTLVELLVQAYKKGYTFSEHAARYKKSKASKPKLYDEMYLSCATDSPKEVKNLPALFDEYAIPVTGITSEYWRLQEKLYEMETEPFVRDTPLYQTNIVTINRVFKIYERNKYNQWLFKYDKLNPHIDYVPMMHRYICCWDGVHFLYGDRYEGRKAAEFAPASRGNKVTSWYLDCKWNRYLCYYHSFQKGYITGEQLRSIGKFIYRETQSSDALIRADQLSVSVEEPKPMLLLPAPAVNVEMPDQSKETKVVRSILETHSHSSGVAHDDVYHLLLRKAWKTLPSMLIQVPEDFNPQENKCIITDIHKVEIKERQAMSA